MFPPTIMNQSGNGRNELDYIQIFKISWNDISKKNLKILKILFNTGLKKKRISVMLNSLLWQLQCIAFLECLPNLNEFLVAAKSLFLINEIDLEMILLKHLNV